MWCMLNGRYGSLLFFIMMEYLFVVLLVYLGCLSLAMDSMEAQTCSLICLAEGCCELCVGLTVFVLLYSFVGSGLLVYYRQY